jgi:hypothetical protein
VGAKTVRSPVKITPTHVGGVTKLALLSMPWVVSLITIRGSPAPASRVLISVGVSRTVAIAEAGKEPGNAVAGADATGGDVVAGLALGGVDGFVVDRPPK